MNVRLISITKPVLPEIEHFTPEEYMAYVARVSNPANQMNSETSSKLLGYCIRNNHWSVFEHVSLTFEIKTSLAIATQILRHRSGVFQQFSGRYSAAMNNEIYPARRQDAKNRQNSIDDMSQEDKDWFEEAQQSNWEEAFALYNEALNRGIAKEQARFLLPTSTQTTLYFTNNVRNFLHYIDLRTDPSTQKEHRDIALEMKSVFIDQFPAISEAKGWK